MAKLSSSLFTRDDGPSSQVFSGMMRGRFSGVSICGGRWRGRNMKRASQPKSTEESHPGFQPTLCAIIRPPSIIRPCVLPTCICLCCTTSTSTTLVVGDIVCTLSRVRNLLSRVLSVPLLPSISDPYLQPYPNRDRPSAHEIELIILESFLGSCKGNNRRALAGLPSMC